MAGSAQGSSAGGRTDPRLLLLDPNDTVFVTRERIPAGTQVTIEDLAVRMAVGVGIGHKLARRPMQPGDKVLKYGAPIGVVTAPVAAGDHVHVHNVRSDYTPTYHLVGAEDAP